MDTLVKFTFRKEKSALTMKIPALFLGIGIMFLCSDAEIVLILSVS